MTGLALERRGQEDRTVRFDLPNGDEKVTALFTPPISPDYWTYRVVVADGQAVIGFPKFGVIGIGFAVEADDWNTNLPSMIEAPDIARHIWRNRGPALADDVPTFDRVVEAITLIQAAVAEDREAFDVEEPS